MWDDHSSQSRSFARDQMQLTPATQKQPIAIILIFPILDFNLIFYLIRFYFRAF